MRKLSLQPKLCVQYLVLSLQLTGCLQSGLDNLDPTQRWLADGNILNIFSRQSVVEVNMKPVCVTPHHHVLKHVNRKRVCLFWQLFDNLSAGAIHFN